MDLGSLIFWGIVVWIVWSAVRASQAESSSSRRQPQRPVPSLASRPAPNTPRLPPTTPFPTSVRPWLGAPSDPGGRSRTLYRPRASSWGSRAITFRASQADSGELPFHSVADLVDALTGAALNPALGLHRCKVCQVFYQESSLEVLRAENGRRCVSCLQTAIVAVPASQRGRNADPSLVTLANYRHFIGRVITFEGYVYAVLVSQRGMDYAVMFEDRPWVHGFKMVIFAGDADRVGSREFISALEGRTVRVRGLLIHHGEFGHEIIVTDRGMILAVR